MEKIPVSISSVLQDLKDGLTRDDIAVKYGLNKSEVKRMFKHPKLKFKKTIRPGGERFQLIDDTEEEASADTQELAQSPGPQYVQSNLIDAIAREEAVAEQTQVEEGNVEESSTW